MAHKGTYAGIGGGGVKKGSQLAADIIAMSDPAKRAKKLEETVTAKQKAMRDKGRKPRSITKLRAERLLESAKPVGAKITNLQKRAAALRLKAQAVSKTNKRAAETYRQAATELLARIPAMRKK